MVEQQSHPLQPDHFELLNTKFAPPRVRSINVIRGSLLPKLDAGLTRKLTLISAPAGFGKSTLVAQWMSTVSQAVGWLSLDEGDNDPTRFWQYLITCTQHFKSELGNSALAMLRAPQHRLDAVLKAYINELAQLAQPCVLVLEDYHVIQTPLIHQTLSQLIERLPEPLHLVIITRTDPPLPLARLRAHDDMIEFRADDLLFSADEISAFLDQMLPFPLPAAFIQRLAQRTEGWIVGLQVAALSLQKRHHAADIDEFLTTFTGGHRHILDYLMAEVLAEQPSDVQDFLLKTAFLDHLSASLCDAVTERSDSQTLLKTIEQANLFLLPVDDVQQSYRYHALFAEAMQHHAHQQLGEHAVRELHQRASDWYEVRGHLAEAVEAALAACQYAQAAALIERLIQPTQMGNEYHTLRRWIDQLPDDMMRERPDLCLTYAVALLFSSNRNAPSTLERMSKPLEMAERCWREQHNDTKIGEVLAVRSLATYWQGQWTRSFVLARQSLELLDEQAPEWYGIMLLHSATGEWFEGNSEVARRLGQAGRQLSEQVGNGYAHRATTWLLGEIALSQGKLYEAEQLFDDLLQTSGDDPRDHAHAVIGLGTIAVERHQLDTAHEWMKQGSEVAQNLRDEHILVDTAILEARVRYACGDTAAALQTLSAQMSQMRIPFLMRKLRAWQAGFALLDGDLRTAHGWYQTYSSSQSDEIPVMVQELEALTAARLLIVQGKPADAYPLLASWEARARAGQRTRSQLEVMILQALAYAVDKQRAQAKAALMQALEIAQPAGYIGLFLQEGDMIEALLKEVYISDHQPWTPFVHALLRAFEANQARNAAASHLAAQPVIERLSPQEQRVFRLIGDGLAAGEIAQELGVSINTIKTQLKSIYSKLNLRSRQEARRLSSQLHLL